MNAPPIHSALMAWLKTNYPPRCRRPGEDELTHERYAGRIDLIGELEEIFKNQVAPDATPDDLTQGVTFEDLFEEEED